MPVSRENVDEFVIETVFNDNGAVRGFTILEDKQKAVIKNTEKMKNSVAKLDDESRKFVNTNKRLSGALKSLFAVFAVKKIVDYTEQWANIRKLLATITDNEEQRKVLENGLYKTAINTRQSLEQTISLYRGLYIATRSMGVSESQRLQVLENINKTLSIGGGTAQENQVAIQKLLLALSSGQLKGRSLTNLIKTAPELAKMIADGFGVSIERMREMADAGKLTTKNVFDAILTQTTKIDTKFKKTGITIKEAFTNLSTSIGKLMDTDVGGAIGLLAKSMNWLANNTWALQTAFVSFALVKGGKFIKYILALRSSFLETRAAIGTVKNALQIMVSGDILAGIGALIKSIKAFAVASWSAVAPWLTVLATITSILIVIDELMSIFTGRTSLLQKGIFSMIDSMTGQNKSASLSPTYLSGANRVSPAVYPTNSRVNNETNNEFVFNINGSQSPVATGREIERILTTRLRQAGAF